jgi:hypothetical protein
MENKLKKIIYKENSLIVVSKELRKIKNNGYTKEQVIEYLNRCRIDALEKEDWILEILDIVEGYCKPELKVW